MKDSNTTHRFPRVQIKPYDGMAVTADIWSQAHEEHRHYERAHNLLLHGSGIISGLEVVANDPADNFVFISPGVAIDTGGNVIELIEPVAYDFGESAEGIFYLLLGHGEREISGVQEGVRYIQNEFVIAARSSLPRRPYVELARISISDSAESIQNVADPEHPKANELDLRFRIPIKLSTIHQVRTAIISLGEKPQDLSPGWVHLNNQIKRSTHIQLILDPAKEISDGLTRYDLVYLGVKGTYDFSEKAIGAIKKYLTLGKGMLIEALDETAQETCQALLKSLKRNCKPLKAGQKLFQQPFLFSSVPEGPFGEEVLVDGRVVYSTVGYCFAWAGQNAQGSLSRADIRSLHEWGVNVVSYLLL